MGNEGKVSIHPPIQEHIHACIHTYLHTLMHTCCPNLLYISSSSSRRSLLEARTEAIQQVDQAIDGPGSRSKTGGRTQGASNTGGVGPLVLLFSLVNFASDGHWLASWSGAMECS